MDPLLPREVAVYLASQGFGFLSDDKTVMGNARNIFFIEEPEKPDNVITVLEEPGSPPVNVFGERRAFTVRTRHEEPAEAQSLAQEIHRALHFQQGILQSIQVGLIQADTNPIPLGRDQNRRFIVSQTFSVVLKTINGPIQPA
ncbi:MAG: minor capsid protein [Gemmatimonadota bacterium]